MRGRGRSNKGQSWMVKGGELSFFTPKYSFPARKKWFLWDTTQNTETSQKKQAKVCGQTKIANVALSLSWGGATSTLMYPTAYKIAHSYSGISRNAFVQTFLYLLGWLGQCRFAWKANLAKKLDKYTWVPTTHYYSINITDVGIFLSRHKQSTPISAHKCYETRGWGRARGLFVVRLPTAKVYKVHEIASWNIWYVCKGVCKPEHMIWLFACVCMHALLLLLSLVVKLALLPSLRWHCCRQCAGIFSIVVMAIVALVTIELLPSLMHRHLCHCQTSITPSSLDVKLVLSPLLWWYRCHWCTGIFATIAIMIVSLMTMAL